MLLRLVVTRCRGWVLRRLRHRTPLDGGRSTPAASHRDTSRAFQQLLVVGMVPAILLSGCSVRSAIPAAPAGTVTLPAVGTEQPLKPETNPPGDIPDTQAFVAFASSAGGYSLEVPEGWARTVNGADARFVDKFNGVQVTVAATPVPPTAATVPTTFAADLQRLGHAVTITKLQDVGLPGGSAVFVEYSSNSDPDSVTGKRVRLENNAYLFYKAGKLATITLWAPLGADNVDQWQRMSTSFRWS